MAPPLRIGLRPTTGLAHIETKVHSGHITPYPWFSGNFSIVLIIFPKLENSESNDKSLESPNLELYNQEINWPWNHPEGSYTPSTKKALHLQKFDWSLS